MDIFWRKINKELAYRESKIKEKYSETPMLTGGMGSTNLGINGNSFARIDNLPSNPGYFTYQEAPVNN